jgi:hypothetical protein
MPSDTEYVTLARAFTAKAAAEREPARRAAYLRLAAAYHDLANVKKRWQDQPDRVLTNSDKLLDR